MNFEDRAVAFVDVLGFKKLVDSAEEGSDQGKLDGLIATIESHVRYDNDLLSRAVPQELCPVYTFISDSLILSAPLNLEGYDGLTIVTLKTIQVAHKLLEMGYLVRGGISIGKTSHTAQNIIGNGYISAYQAEQMAKHPRIVLTTKAAAHLENALHLGIPSRTLDMWLKEDGSYLVDTLYPRVINDITQHGRIEGAYQQYKAHIHAALENTPPGSSERGKWEWMAEFFNSAIARYDIGCKPLLNWPFPSRQNVWIRP